MDKQVYKEVLLRLGFIDQKYLEKVSLEEKSEDLTPQYSSMQGIWSNLGGESKGHITLNNLRIFLLSVMGTFVEPTLNRDE